MTDNTKIYLSDNLIFMYNISMQRVSGYFLFGPLTDQNPLG